MVSVGVSKLRKTQLVFVDPGVKINGAYYLIILSYHISLSSFICPSCLEYLSSTRADSSKDLALYKPFTYLLTYLLTVMCFSLGSCERSLASSLSSARQCSYTPSTWDTQPSGTGDTRVHFTRLVAPKQSRSESSWLQNLGENGTVCLPDEISWRRWIEAASDRCLAWLGAKRRRSNWWVAQNVFVCAFERKEDTLSI